MGPEQQIQDSDEFKLIKGGTLEMSHGIFPRQLFSSKAK